MHFSIFQNYCYGKTCQNPDNHKNVHIVSEASARAAVSKPTFESCEGIGNDIFEITTKKSNVHHKTCLQVAGSVYATAKYHMLSFLYEYFYPCMDLNKIELSFSDTDSLAFSLSEDNFEMCLLPEKKQFFYENWHKWFPRQACSEHYKKWLDLKCSSENYVEFEQQKCCKDCTQYDQRTLFLFKKELENIDCFVSLCAKTYICISKFFDLKISSKGLQKNRNADRLQIMNFLNVLSEQRDMYGLNRGFRYVTQVHGMTSYKELRRGLPFYYQKRNVLEDCISTEPLYNV